jgi:hypothetical protein
MPRVQMTRTTRIALTSLMVYLVVLVALLVVRFFRVV